MSGGSKPYVAYFRKCKTDGVTVQVPSTKARDSVMPRELISHIMSGMQPLDRPVPEIREVDKTWDEILGPAVSR